MSGIGLQRQQADRAARAEAKASGKPFISGYCNVTLPRTEKYDPHGQCPGCDCGAENCHRAGMAGEATVDAPAAVDPVIPGGAPELHGLRVLPDLIQGSDEWHDQRRGMVTASVVGKLLTPTLKVADNDTSRGLTATLAAERITGWTEETAMTPDMWRGVEHEPYARDVYSGHYQQAEEVGFMLREEEGWRLGYSPDGLVSTDGLIEIKAPRAKTHLKTILADTVPAHYMPQLQAGLLVSGRDWVDFVSFVAGMPLYVKRVKADPAWFAAITAACIAFETNVAQIVADYEKRVDGMPKTERLDFEIKVA